MAFAKETLIAQTYSKEALVGGTGGVTTKFGTARFGAARFGRDAGAVAPTKEALQTGNFQNNKVALS